MFSGKTNYENWPKIVNYEDTEHNNPGVGCRFKNAFFFTADH